jgi:hypothetical protein
MKRSACAPIGSRTSTTRQDGTIAQRRDVVARDRPTARSQRVLASLAVAAAERREHAAASGHAGLDFDGSILALRKFTSSELLDVGFNVSMVAQRQDTVHKS